MKRGERKEGCRGGTMRGGHGKNEEE